MSPPVAPKRKRVFPKLSPRGRQRTGNFVAIGLGGASAGIVTTVILPAAAGDPIDTLIFAFGLISAILFAGASVVAKLMTEEREGEASGDD